MDTQKEKLTIEQARQKHTDRLLKQDGIEGVGLGENEDGEPAFVISTSGDDVNVPDNLEGYPVVAQATRKDEAYKDYK